MGAIKGFTLIFLVLISCLASADRHLALTTGEWRPYMTSEMANQGIISDLVRKAFEAQGYEVTFSFFPWKRAELLTHQAPENWDASCCWWPNDETRKDFILSDPVHHSDVVFFHLKDKPLEWKKVEDFRPLKVGTTIGYAYGDQFELARQRAIVEVHLAASDELNFKKLLAGRIDAFPNDPIVGYAQLRSMYPQDIVNRFSFHPKRLINTYLHLAASKHNPNAQSLIETFNQGLETIRANGTYEKIITGSYYLPQ